MRDAIRRRLAAKDADEGFTLVEILVAMFIILMVMSSLLVVLVSTLKTVTQARQRQTATAVATQAIERLRALPYDSVTGSAPAYGMTAGLQHVVTGAPARFVPAGVLVGVDEELVVNEYSAKRATQQVDGVDYIVQTYVTKAPLTASGQQSYNLSAVVSWTSAVYPTARTVAQRSTTYSPAGCLSTAQRPFAAPCQAYFTAQAGQSAAAISVTNADDSTVPIPGIDGTLLELSLPVLSTNLLMEQTASASSSAVTSSARAVSPPSVPTIVGDKAAAVSVDSDPASTPVLSGAATASQSGGTVVLAGSAGSLSARPTSGDTASGAAAIAADSTTCRDGTTALTPLQTGPVSALRPCVSASVRQQATAGSIRYTAPTGAPVDLVSLQEAATPSHAVAAQLALANPTACPAMTAGSAGCAHAAATRSLGLLVVGEPNGGATGPTPAYSGLWKVTGLTESARAESGAGSSAPAFTRGGTLQFWDGAGYQSVALANFAAPPTSSQTQSTTWTASATMDLPTGQSILAEATITVQRPSLTVTGTDCKVVACTSQVTNAGGLVAKTVFTVTDGGGELTKFVVVSDLGGLVVQSTFKAAPDA